MESQIEKLTVALQNIVIELAGEHVAVKLSIPSSTTHGDYSSNIAMILAKSMKKNPMAVAEEIAVKLRAKSKELSVEKVEVAPPGFINITLSKEYLVDHLASTSDVDMQIPSPMQGKKILVEYAHPNTHKEMHIGHMRTLITGEAMCRIFEAAGALVFRANYQGDIGPHVAKAMYGIQKIMDEKDLNLSEVDSWSNKDKAHFLGEGYVRGNVDYDLQKKVIDELNTALYQKDPGVMDLYTKTRQWSLDYYDEFYTRFYTKFDRLFFESEMVERGKKIVIDNLGKVFTKDNNAIIFPGEKYDVHTRVFITHAGNPTYEGKEMANGFTEYEAFPFDLKMHIVGSEQAGYFQVVFKALEMLDAKKFKDKQHHVSMGMVTLTDPSAVSGQSRKMSSRTGDILKVDWLIDQVRERVGKLVEEGKIQAENRDKVIEQVAIGAIKYSVLKVGTGQNVAFDIEKSVSLEGDSGPYIQYTFARTQSLLAKGKAQRAKSENAKPSALSSKLEAEEYQLLRKLLHFDEVVVDAAEKYAPNVLTTYLFDLAHTFNLFYQKQKIIGSTHEQFRLKLTEKVGLALQNGLNLLGIQAPERM